MHEFTLLPNQPNHPSVASEHYKMAETYDQDEFDNLPKALELNFDASSSKIHLTLFEHCDHLKEPVPLHLQYDYVPSAGFAPSELLWTILKGLRAAHADLL